MAQVHLLDTSVAVALMAESHLAHDDCFAFARGKRLGLAGHAFFETLSVLTRLPSQGRPTASSAHQALTRTFPSTVFLNAKQSTSAAKAIAELGIGGGAIFDALVANAALSAGVPLASRDTRALATYQAIGVKVVFVG